MLSHLCVVYQAHAKVSPFTNFPWDFGSNILSPPFNSTWLRSDAADTKLTVLPNGTLSWDGPKHFTGLFTYLPEALPFENDGAVINITMRWRSNGEESCPKSCYSDGNWCQQESCQKLKCVSHSVSCLGGTGDFRIALLDTSRSDGKTVRDNWCNGTRAYGAMTKCVESEPFAKMQGYDFRIFPHLTKKAKHEPGQVPCSIYKKDSDNLFGKARLGEWGCFDTPLGRWTVLSLFLKRRDSTRVEIGMTMNGITYETHDTVDPKAKTTIRHVDAIAIGYPNERKYSYVQLSAIDVVTR